MGAETEKGRFYISKTISIGDWLWSALKCMVCNLNLSESEERLFCPYCGNPAHKYHLLEWIKVKEFCPYCRRRLRINDLTGGSRI